MEYKYLKEEMKQILFEDAGMRIDTLRKVFGIDKYKTITDNTAIVIKDLREKQKTYEGTLYDYDDKKKIKQRLVLEQDEIKKKLDEILPKQEDTKQGCDAFEHRRTSPYLASSMYLFEIWPTPPATLTPSTSACHLNCDNAYSSCNPEATGAMFESR